MFDIRRLIELISTRIKPGAAERKCGEPIIPAFNRAELVEALGPGDLTVGRRVTIHFVNLECDYHFIVLSEPFLAPVVNGPELSATLRVKLLPAQWAGLYSEEDILAGRIHEQHTRVMYLTDMGVLPYAACGWNPNNYTTATPADVPATPNS